MLILNNGDSKKDAVENFSEKLLEIEEKYDNIYIKRICDQVFVYRPIGRKEYTNLQQSDKNNFEKEELVCTCCTLYPEDYDFSTCDAGIPTVLAKHIVEDSYLTYENRRDLLIYYRKKMYDIDNQITCIINEAFPEIPVSEIENWDVVKTTEYLSKAEWKLKNLRNFQVNGDMVDYFDQMAKLEKEGFKDNKKEPDVPEIKESEEEINLKGEKKKKLSKEELDALKKQYPELVTSVDEMFNDPGADTRPVALRPRIR